MNIDKFYWIIFESIFYDKGRFDEKKEKQIFFFSVFFNYLQGIFFSIFSHSRNFLTKKNL